MTCCCGHRDQSGHGFHHRMCTRYVLQSVPPCVRHQRRRQPTHQKASKKAKAPQLASVRVYCSGFRLPAREQGPVRLHHRHVRVARRRPHTLPWNNDVFKKLSKNKVTLRQRRRRLRVRDVARAITGTLTTIRVSRSQASRACEVWRCALPRVVKVRRRLSIPRELKKGKAEAGRIRVSAWRWKLFGEEKK